MGSQLLTEDVALLNSCYFVFITEAEGTTREKNFISKLKMLSNAAGKKYVLILTEDMMNAKLQSKLTDKKAKAKGGSIVTKASVIVPILNEGVFISIIKETVIEYLQSLKKSTDQITKEPSLDIISKKEGKKGASKIEESKIVLNNLEDDKPPMSPDLFVVLVGFTDPNLILEMNNQKLPLKCIVKVRDKTKSLSSFRSSVTSFWKMIDLYAGMSTSNFFVSILNIVNMSANNVNFNYIYDILCCVLYDIVNIVNQYTKYVNNCHVYPLEYLQVDKKPIYNELIMQVPLECTTEEYVLHCIIEQVVYFDEARLKMKKTEENDNVSVVSNFSGGFMSNKFLNDESDTKEDYGKASTTGNSFEKLLQLDEGSTCKFDYEGQSPSVMEIINKYEFKSRTFYHRDKCARNTFHLEQFTDLYLILLKIIKNSVKHLQTLPHVLTFKKKSLFEFHVNRLLKHAKIHLPFIKQRQMKYYLELLLLLKYRASEAHQSFNFLNMIPENTTDDDRRDTLGKKCLEKINSKYEQKSNLESDVEEVVEESLAATNVHDPNESDSTLSTPWGIYAARKQQQLEELRKLLFLDEFDSLINFVNSNGYFSSSLLNIQVEHLDVIVLPQVLHQERFLYQNYEVKYFAPTDSHLIIFFNNCNLAKKWSSSGSIPVFLSMQNFFNSMVCKSEDEWSDNIFSNYEEQGPFLTRQYFEDELYAFDTGESVGILSESELTFDEHEQTIVVKRSTIDSTDFISVLLQFQDVFTNIYGRKHSETSEPSHDEMSMENRSKNSVHSLYKFDDYIKIVLVESIIITISKHKHAIKEEPPKLNFSITLPNGLFVETVQMENEMVIRQSFIQQSNEEVCRYYFKSGKVLIVHENGTYDVYHGNGDKTHCKGVRKEQVISEEVQTSKLSITFTRQRKEREKNYENLTDFSSKINPTSLEKTRIVFDVVEHEDALGNFKRFEKNKLTEENSKYAYKYACSFDSGELYLTREDGVQLYFLDAHEKNIMITKFDCITFSSKYYLGDEYHPCTLENDTKSELHVIEEIGRMGSAKSLDFTSNLYVTEDSNMSSGDNFVFVDQTWTMEHNGFVPITFNTEGKCEISINDFHICYQNETMYIHNENINIQANVNSVVFKCLGGKNVQESQVTLFQWNEISDDSDDVIRADRSEGPSFYLKADGSTVVTKCDKSEQANVSILNGCKCFVVNRDGSGYEFVNNSANLKPAKHSRSFQDIQFKLPNCSELLQTNIQRKTKPLCDRFLFKPNPIHPIALTRYELKSSENSNNNWLFYPDVDVRPKVNFSEKVLVEQDSLELRKFEEIAPPNVDILQIMRSSFQAYCEEGSTLCDQFEMKNLILVEK